MNSTRPRTPSVEAALVGGKASRLTALAEAGLPVPPFIVVPASESGRIDDEVIREIDAFLDACPPAARFAVRSSAAGEDAPGASHAGQFATVLGVPRARVLPAVAQVIASAGRDSVGLYRRELGVGASPVSMSVVIQVMVDARAAGVAFTRDPVTGERALVVVAALGLGTGVVEDRVPTDTYRRPFGALAWERAIAAKTERQVYSREFEGVRTEPVSADRAGLPALAPAELETLGETLDRIADANARPQDVEWAVDVTGRLWVLQARAATSIPSEPLEVWDDSNVGENYPGFTRPLTFSLARRTYQQLFTRAMAEIGVRPSALAGDRHSLERLLGLVRGRLYLNLTSYYGLFRSVPGLEHTIGDWQKAFGIEAPAGSTRRAGRTRRAGPIQRARTWIRLGRRFLANDRHVRDCLSSTEQILAQAKQEPAGSGSTAILEAFRRLERALLPGWTAIIYDDFYLFYLLGRLERRLGGITGTLLGGANGRGMASLEAAGSLQDLAQRAWALPGAPELLEGCQRDLETWNELLRLDRDGGFREAVDRHLDLHGDRAIGELKLETVTPAEAPWLLLPVLRHLAGARASGAVREPGHRGGEAQPRAPGDPGSRAGAELREQLQGRPLTRLTASWLLRRCRHLVVNRENLSAARARAYGAMRRLFRALGNALAAEGQLEEPDLVFDLLLENLEDFAAGRMPPGELSRLARGRRERYARWAAEPAPAHRVITGTSLAVPAAAVESADLRGIPCSVGLATAPVRVVLDPGGAENVGGAIIVAPVTELGWLPLLLQARGLIVERGSILSHAGIIARELGLPAIVGVPGATTRLHDGEVVEMDGSTGSIRLLRD